MKAFGFELKTKGLYNVIYKKTYPTFTWEVILDLTNPTEIYFEKINTVLTKGLSL